VTWVIFVVVLMGLILIHETGHFVVARWCGMRVERFSIFFGKPLLRFTRGETEFRIGWIPAGGYVKITGMTREELFPSPRTGHLGEDGQEAPLPAPPPPEVVARAYFAQKPWKRIATIFAGPAVNIILAVLAFAVAFWVGSPTLTPTDRVDQIEVGSPAAQAGLRVGDRIVGVNGIGRLENPDAFQQEVRGNANRPVALQIERDGAPLTLDAVPRELGGPAGRAVRIGVSFAVDEGPVDRRGFLEGLGDGGEFAWDLTRLNFEAIGGAFTSEETRDQIGSVVGIGQAFETAQEDGFITVLRYIGYISLILGIFNLLPLLPLDGGHILFTIIEKLKGSAISGAAYARASAVGLGLMLLLFFLVALPNDVGRLSGEGQLGR